MSLKRTMNLDLDRTSPARAREFVSSMKDHIGEKSLKDVLLLTSELVSNVLRHAKFSSGIAPKVWVEVTVRDTIVRCCIYDNSGGFAPPESFTPSERSIGGWGLHMVDKISSDWGVSRGIVDGLSLFCVWFELRK